MVKPASINLSHPDAWYNNGLVICALETSILTEVDSRNWIALMSIADCSGAYNCYFGPLDTGKVKIMGMMARKGDTPKYVRRMQQELFDCLGEARGREELVRVESKAQGIYRRYRDGLVDVDERELAIHRRVSRLSYSRRCAEASAVKAYLNQGASLALGMEIEYVVRDASRWEVEPKRQASGFDAEYYGKLLEKVWGEAAFVFGAGRQPVR